MTSGDRLSMRGIVKRFGGVTALSDGNLAVRAGEIQALMGANGAGKSTLMNILGGVIPADAGAIWIDGSAVAIHSARDAARHGIVFVHQELTTLATMSVAENIFVDGFPGHGFRIDRATMRKRAGELLDLVGCHADPDAPVELLSTGDRQLVEIARAMKTEPKTIILDEPTSSLSQPEREKVFALMRTLKSHGASVIFISHFLDEVFTVCDRVTVMRDGATVSTGDVAATTRQRVVEDMLGSVHETDRVRPPVDAPDLPFLTVEGLDGGPLVNDVSFRIHRGEIVGLWGLLGSGRTELVRALMGLDTIRSGTVQLHDADGTAHPIAPAALRQRTGLVTEDRRGEGVIMPFSVTRNISLPDIFSFTGRLGLVSAAREDAAAREMVERIGIKTASPAKPVSTLSGGNQQMVVFARWLHVRPDFYVLDEPTRGLDTGAKTEILKLIVKLAQEGAAILMISSELEELMRVADRYLILRRGHVAGILGGDADQRDLLAAVSGEDFEAVA
ncbi:MAG: sugar ABC transporter ATP-binding protein [Pseudomonadota bacterium]